MGMTPTEKREILVAYLKLKVQRRRTDRTVRARARARATFIDRLAETGNVSAACRASLIARRTAYEWRDADKAFAASWDEAVEIATDALEAEARRRAVDGVQEPVFHQGRKCGTVRKYSDRMLEILLKGHRPEKYREKVDMHHSGRLTLEKLVEQSGKDDDHGS